MFKKPTQQDVLRISLGHNGPVTVHNMQSDDEPGGLLRGTVVLDCPNELRIKALTLKFEGRAKVMWSEDGQYFRDERQVIHHEWHFLSSLPYNKAHRLNGKHCYHFSLPLPADLPSSLSEDRATISYHLKAVAERPAFSTNFVYKRTINVQREVLTPTLMRPVSSARTASSFSYRVQLNRHVYSPGAIVPLDVQVHTVCKVQSFVCVLKNYVTLVTARHACRFSHTLAYLRDDHFGPRQGDNASQHDIILKTEQLKIPEHLVADTQTELLRVKHKLKISFMLIRQDGTPAQVKTTIPISVTHLFEPETAQTVPPTYEEANNLDTTYLTALNRVPSYSSIATQTDIPHRFSRQSLLPAYDSITST